VILPTKHIPLRRSLLGVSALLLRHVTDGCTVSQLWDRVRGSPEMRTFGVFVLALDLLFMVGAVELEEGLLRRHA
jgi:hypothetical protein